MPLRMSLPRPGEPSWLGMTSHTETLFPKRATENITRRETGDPPETVPQRGDPYRLIRLIRLA